ncbi:MAG: ABC transporter substrate-binding protein [Candidatus Spyradocola sp.]|jgi:iron complex transport system substrate-binding protein
MTLRRAAVPALLLALLLLLSACAQSADPAEPVIQFVDDNGRTISLAARPTRVAAVQSSFADLWQLAGGEVYATSQETFDEGIVELSQDVINLGSVKTPDLETILASGTDFVILSANLADHADIGEALEGAGVPCAYFDVETFDDYLRVLQIFTDLTDRADLYEQYGAGVQARVQAAIDRKEGQEAPTVLLLRAYSTGVRAKGSDNMTGAMLKDLGCINIADSETSLLEDLSLEVILEEDPDFIFVTTMGSSDEAALASLDELLLSNPAWESLTAVQEGRLHLLPKDLFHLKPNERWGESYEILADYLYGEA